MPVNISGEVTDIGSGIRTICKKMSVWILAFKRILLVTLGLGLGYWITGLNRPNRWLGHVSMSKATVYYSLKQVMTAR